MKKALIGLMLLALGVSAYLLLKPAEEFDFDQVDVAELKAARDACLAAQQQSAPEGFTPINMPFYFGRWFVGVGGEGYYRRVDDVLELHFAFIKAGLPTRVNPYFPDGDHFIEGIQVGLARESIDGAFRTDQPVERWSGMLHVNQPISRGQILQFDNFSTTISVEGIPDLTDYFLMLKADVTHAFDDYRASYMAEDPELLEARARVRCRV